MIEKYGEEFYAEKCMKKCQKEEIGLVFPMRTNEETNLEQALSKISRRKRKSYFRLGVA